jgi:hypothetical protein
MAEVLAVAMRWLHISSVALLIGGMLYGRMALKVTNGMLPPDNVEKFGASVASRFRPWVLFCAAALILSGIYNLLASPGHTARYLILFAIKLLLVLHVFASAILATGSSNPRRMRLMASAGISGLIVILISAYLRRIF